MRSVLSPKAWAAPSAEAPDEFKRPAPGPGSKESLDGDRRAWAVGHRRPPELAAITRTPTPPVRGQLLRAAAVSGYSRDPTCREVPGEPSQGLLTLGGAGREEARRGGVWVTGL